MSILLIGVRGGYASAYANTKGVAPPSPSSVLSLPLVERAIYRLCCAVLRRVSAAVVVSVRVGRCVVVCADGDIFLSVTSIFPTYFDLLVSTPW